MNNNPADLLKNRKSGQTVGILTPKIPPSKMEQIGTFAVSLTQKLINSVSTVIPIEKGP